MWSEAEKIDYSDNDNNYDGMSVEEFTKMMF